ncbi:hypothetical protein PG993_010257 [Apiospora rasikravindrae]|uniref:Uncharacterized protein n=1 Tax=Apiospora rasikravindrae TaxID=990691 RepID=A0ABR1SLS5_9PEZI
MGDEGEDVDDSGAGKKASSGLREGGTEAPTGGDRLQNGHRGCPEQENARMRPEAGSPIKSRTQASRERERVSANMEDQHAEVAPREDATARDPARRTAERSQAVPGAQ